MKKKSKTRTPEQDLAALGIEPAQAALRYIEKVFSGMPCSNRVSAAEKAAFDKCFAKELALRRARNLKVLEKLRRDHHEKGR